MARLVRLIAAISLIALCASGSALAQSQEFAELTSIVPPQPGEKVCFVRKYDAQHLKQHPKQRITSVLFLMRVVGITKDGDYVHTPEADRDRLSYQFGMQVSRRGEKRVLRAGGFCGATNGLMVRG